MAGMAEEPGTRLGQVFRKQYVNAQHPNAAAIRSLATETKVDR